jgi:uncharacterized protein (TIGR00266 family)
LSDGAKFCVSCGRAVGAAGPAGPTPNAAPPLSYTIEGSNLQMLRVKLAPGQELFAEAGKMVYKTSSVTWETRASGSGLADKLIGMLKRKLTGESLFFTYFRCLGGGGEVGFAGADPGKLECVELAAGQSFLAQRDAFICAENGVGFNVALVKRLGAGFFGGEGFILEQFTGPGKVFIHGGGDFVQFVLKPGETIQVDCGCIVGFDESVDYDIQLAGGIQTAIFGGEGFFLATLTGPGRCIVQTLTLARLRREIGGQQRGGEEKTPLEALGGLTNIFTSED